MNDLFGEPVIDKPLLTKNGKPKRDETPKGYAAPPGTGPAGHFCRDCRHAISPDSDRYWKCKLLWPGWTKGYGTDIRLKSQACMHWASKVQQDPNGECLCPTIIKIPTIKARA